jgi:hypothetical protein
MELDDLAKDLDVLESTDRTRFRRRARILQSMWRKEKGIDPGEHKWKHKGEYGVRPLGSRLPMPEAKEKLTNYLTDNIREIVKEEVCDPDQSEGKLYKEPRIFDDLLSSQPLCFNLFAELKRDLDLASSVVSALSNGRFAVATDILFEHSPGRRDPRYLNDRSAFDVFLKCKNTAGAKCFIGIEVKCHENLYGSAGDHKKRYDEVADLMKCFPDDRSSLKKSPLQQIWRDHLLAGITHIEDGYSDSVFVTLYPKDNHNVTKALDRYMFQLHDKSTIEIWTLEQFVESLSKYSNASWIQMFHDRYLAFDKIDRLLAKAD